MGKWVRKLMGTVITVVVGLVLVALWVRWMEPRSIYFPVRQEGPYDLPQDFAPQDVYLEALDGVRLHGWFFARDAHPHTNDGVPSRGFTVLYLHGNAGNLMDRLAKADLLMRCGLDVFVIDYRGYGLSEGRPNERGTYHDARVAFRYLTEERGLDHARIVILGESLGSAVAVHLAREVSPPGLVIEAAFTSIGDVAQATYPFLPVRWLVTHKYDSIGKIGDIRAPILIFHSEDDEYFPMRHAERLRSAAQSARLVRLRGGHNEASIQSEAVYRKAMEDFIGQLTQGPVQ